jgi:acyl-CoA thioesterase
MTAGAAGGTLASDTAVEPLGGGRYRASVDPSWWIIAGPNGGYVAAIVLRAVVAEVAEPARRPRSATFHYLRSPAAGPVEVEVTVERAGRTVTDVSARLVQDGRTLVTALVALGLDREAPVSFDEDAGLPLDPAGAVIPPPEQVAPDAVDPERHVPMRDHYDLRWVLGAAPFTSPDGGPPGPRSAARCAGWMRLREDDPVDEVVLVAMADAWLPPVFSRVDVPLAVPTVDLTVHFRHRAERADPWCFIDTASPVAADGYLVEHAELRDRHGRLLAESRQTAVVS